jgi:hypothetical protein
MWQNLNRSVVPFPFLFTEPAAFGHCPVFRKKKNRSGSKMYQFPTQFGLLERANFNHFTNNETSYSVWNTELWTQSRGSWLIAQYPSSEISLGATAWKWKFSTTIRPRSCGGHGKTNLSRTQFLLNNICNSSLYITGNALRLFYKAQPVNAVWGNSRCLLWEPYGTNSHKIIQSVLHRKHITFPLKSPTGNGKSRCLLWEPYETHRRTVWAQCRYLAC